MATQHTITSEDDDIRLDRWFKRHYPSLQHSLLEKNLRKGQIRLDGKKAKTSDRVQEGQQLEVRCDLSDAQQDKLPPRKLSPDDSKLIQRAVLYKDANIIIINKPHGLATQGGSKITRSIDGMLDALAFDGQRPKLTHRLDRDTSGVLVLARNSKTATSLMKLFSTRKIEKTYLALVNGLPEPLHGMVELRLRKKDNPRGSGRPSGPEGRDYEVMQVDEKEGQFAQTEYHVKDMLARRFSLVELKPHTGRMHQLRVHMQAIDCPIVGDHKYGGGMTDAESLGVENILHLHAYKIHIPAVGNNRAIEVTAPLPDHMIKSFKALGIDIPRK